jgi:16S rRNA (uracil1498-N3)-methyltransferase
MARELRRVLVAPERLASDGVLHLLAEEQRYLFKVLRLGPGDHFAVINGCGALWSAELQSSEQARLLHPLDAPLEQQAPPRPSLVLAAAVVKRDFEVVIRMAVELGVDRFIPLLCERTAVQGQLRLERWRSIASEAAEQCERLWLPQLDPPLPLPDLLRAVRSEVGQPTSAFWATTRSSLSLPGLDAALTTLSEQPSVVVVACGPEGGWCPEEEQLALSAGWQPVDLGPRILRSSTACVSALSALSSWRASRWGI